MKKWTKLLSIVMALVMLFTCLPATIAFAGEEETKEVVWKEIEEYPEEFVLFDAEDEKSIKELGLTPDKKITNEKKLSAKWEFSSVKSLKFNKTTDFAGYETIEFYLYGDEKHPSSLFLYISAENPDTEGSDYYNGGAFEIKPGWNLYSFDVAKIAGKRGKTPRPINNVDGLCFHASGWGMDKVNDLDNTVLYLDSIVLKRGSEVIGKPAERVPEEEAGIAKYFEFDFEAERLEDVKGASFAAKENKMEIVKDAKSKRSYLKIEKLESDPSSDCHIDIKVTNTGRYLVLQFDMMSEKLQTIQAFTVKDLGNRNNSLGFIRDNGAIVAGDVEVGKMELGKWVNVAFCMDVENHIFDVYIDGELKAKELDFREPDLGAISLVRLFHIYPGIQAGTNICVDNLRLYDGKSPDDYEKAVGKPGETGKIDVNTEEKPDLYVVEEDAISDVKNAVCLKVDCPTALVKHKKTFIDENNKSVAPMIVNSRTLVPVRFIAETFGAEVSWNDATKTVIVKNEKDTLEFVIGSNIIKKNGEEITIDVPAAIYFDRTMLPLRAVTENLGKKVFWDDMGLIIISDKELNYTKEKDLTKMIDIMAGFTYERPTREQIKSDILKNSPNHPRIFAKAEDFERIRGYMQTDENIKTWLELIKTKAEKFVASSATEVIPNYGYDVGGRLSYGTTSSAIIDKGYSLGLMYQLTGDMKYVDAMWHTLETLCDREKWSNWGSGHFLDAADIMEGVSIAYDWMYDAWTSEQRTIIEDALYDCGIEDGITAYYGADDFLQPPMGVWQRSSWRLTESNWNPSSNGGVMMAAAALATHEKYGDLAIKAMSLAMQSLEVGLRCYAPDGGYPESVGYCAGGTYGVVRNFATLQTVCGSKTAYGLAHAPGFSKVWGTLVYSESKKGMFNYSDSSSSRVETKLLMWFANTFNEPGLMKLRANELTNVEKSASYLDILWYRQESMQNAELALSLDKSFFIQDTMTMRSSWTDQNQIFTGIHGGSNQANHCNLDSGTFILDADDVRWFMDLGADYYNLPGYFSTGVNGERWKYYTQRAEGQNVYAINPTDREDQEVDSVADLFETQSKPRGAYAKLDLTDTYRNDVNKATRGLMLTANRKAVVIQDEIEMKQPSEFYWFAHTQAEIDVAEDGKSAILTSGKKQLYVKLVTADANLKLAAMDAVSILPSYTCHPEEKSLEGIRKLVIHATDVEKVELAVMCMPMYNGEIPEYSYTYTRLDEWNIPDGDILTPKLDGITVGGVAIENFDRDVTNQKFILPYGTTQVPEVVVIPDAQSVYEIVSMPESLPGTATIKVMNKDDKSMYTNYSLFMRAVDEVEVVVSDAQDGNPGENCLDKDFNTRWAVEGEGWAVFNFANPKVVSTFMIATWKAATRNLIFDIQVSEDGTNFTQVWSGKTAATADELEEIKIPEGTYKAIKLVVHGTTAGTWNSILEIAFK